MKTLSIYHFLIIVASLFILHSCSKDETVPPVRRYNLNPGVTDSLVQVTLNEMVDGDTIYFTQGNYHFTSMFTIDKKSNIIFMGEGRDNTKFSFEGQTSGAQSIYATNLKWVLFRDFTITDPIGDGIQAENCDGISFLRVGVTHSMAIDSTNGAYGMDITSCRNILFDDCYVYGTSDAGIYVNQSHQVIVRNSDLEGNVGGIGIVNCINVDIYGNHAHHNAGGILVFDLPDLPYLKSGHNIRIFNNTVDSNDLKNFAPVGHSFYVVPTGTGIMLLSDKTVEIFNDTLIENNVMGIGIISYKTLEAYSGLSVMDTTHDPYCKEINIHDNAITGSTNYPPDLNAFSELIVNTIFGGGDVPDILFDGYMETIPMDTMTMDSMPMDTIKNICLQSNGGATFANMDVPGGFAGLNYDATPYDCTKESLLLVDVIAPDH